MSGDYIIQKAIDPKDMSAKALASMEGKDYDLQPKYDGCHMVVVLRPKRAVDDITHRWAEYECLSATGEPVRSCAHIAEQLRQLAYVTEDTAICGEVWHPGKTFNEISGQFRTHGPQPDLVFAPFDVVRVRPDGVLEDPRPYRERVRGLASWDLADSIVPFHREQYEGLGAAVTEAKRLKRTGAYDGAVLHDMDAPYKVGRCRAAEVVKVKPLIELDLQVTGAELATGDKTGKNTAALVVSIGNGKTNKVATGLSQEQVDDLHANPGSWNGLIVAVEAMGWTPAGKLREPRFKGVRHDKVVPDL